MPASHRPLAAHVLRPQKLNASLPVPLIPSPYRSFKLKRKAGNLSFLLLTRQRQKAAASPSTPLSKDRPASSTQTKPTATSTTTSAPRIVLLESIISSQIPPTFPLPSAKLMASHKPCVRAAN